MSSHIANAHDEASFSASLLDAALSLARTQGPYEMRAYRAYQANGDFGLDLFRVSRGSAIRSRVHGAVDEQLGSVENSGVGAARA